VDEDASLMDAVLWEVDGPLDAAQVTFECNIGSGRTGEVFRGRLRGELVAIKQCTAPAAGVRSSRRSLRSSDSWLA